MMNSNDFKIIKFGDADAETELLYEPDLLKDGFIDDFGFIDDLVRGRKYLVYGLKGSGKTAIGSRIELLYSQKDMTVEKFTLERFNYPLFEGMGYSKSEKSNSNHSNKNSVTENNRTWEMILDVALLGMFSEDPEFDKNSKEIQSFVDNLKKNGVLSNNDLSLIVSKMSKKSFIANFHIFKLNYETTESKTENYRAMYDSLREAVNNVRISKQCIMILDGLDSVVDNTEVQIRVLSGLLHATNEINITLARKKVPAKIVLLCRRDLLDMLKDPNKQKMIDDYGIELDWFQEGVNRDDINLIRLLNKRASLSLGKDVNIFDEFFKEYTSNKKTYKFMLDYTRHIPRDMVRLINEIQKIYVDADKTNINKAIDAYSADYFYGEVENEMVGIMKDGEFDFIMDLFSRIHKYRTSQRELELKAEEIGHKVSKDDMGRILTLLYNVGAIGNVSRVDDKDRYTFKYRDRWSSYNSSDEIVVHLALQKALNVRGGFKRD